MFQSASRAQYRFLQPLNYNYARSCVFHKTRIYFTVAHISQSELRKILLMNSRSCRHSDNDAIAQYVLFPHPRFYSEFHNYVKLVPATSPSAGLVTYFFFFALTNLLTDGSFNGHSKLPDRSAASNKLNEFACRIVHKGCGSQSLHFMP
jgi:hypothetical protein